MGKNLFGMGRARTGLDGKVAPELMAEDSAKAYEQTVADIDHAEEKWTAQADAGLCADIVLVYDLEDAEQSEDAKERAQLRDEALAKLQTPEVQLRVQQYETVSGKRMIVLITTETQLRLEEEAEMRRTSLLLRRDPGDDKSTRAKMMDFKRHCRGSFLLKNGRLFSPLERRITRPGPCPGPHRCVALTRHVCRLQAEADSCDHRRRRVPRRRGA